jgi:predicted transcriptional regulator
VTLGGVGLRAYATFDLKIRTNKLWIAPYSEYQKSLHDMILDMRNKGFTFAEIANHLNETGYKTTRGKSFRNAHAHSILKKKSLRDQRLNLAYEPIIENFNVLFL